MPPARLFVAKTKPDRNAEALARLSSFKVETMTARRAGRTSCTTAAAAPASPKSNAPRRDIPIAINPRSFATCQRLKTPQSSPETLFRVQQNFSYIKTQFNTKNYFGLSFSHHLHTNWSVAVVRKRPRGPARAVSRAIIQRVGTRSDRIGLGSVRRYGRATKPPMPAIASFAAGTAASEKVNRK